MKKISKNRQSFLARKAMHIYKSTVLFLPILGYFYLFLPICESVANLHESTLLFAPNIHAYFCLFFVIRPVLSPASVEAACKLVVSEENPAKFEPVPKIRNRKATSDSLFLVKIRYHTWFLYN